MKELEKPKMASKLVREVCAYELEELALRIATWPARLRATPCEEFPSMRLKLLYLHAQRFAERLDQLDADVKDPSRVIARRKEAKATLELMERFSRESYARAAELARNSNWFSESDDDEEEPFNDQDDEIDVDL